MKTSSEGLKTSAMPSKAMTQIFDVPLVSQFYESPELPPIIESKTKLKLTSVGIYLLTVVAFALLVYQGLTTTQEVSVTVIVPVTTGLDDGFVCKSLGKYSGQAYSCIFTDTNKIVDVLCNPPKPAVNCPNGCSSAGLTLSAGFEWNIQMKHVYFESYGDCVDKIESILKATVASPLSYTYDSVMKWPPYSGPISIGDNTAELQVNLDISAGAVGMSPNVYFSVVRSDNGAFCGTDGTNYNSDGTVITDSSVDQFIKGLSSKLLSDKLTGGASCPTPIAEKVCQPFQTMGPYSCTKTTLITQPVLQVLGSSVSNAATIMTVLSMAIAWIVKQLDQKISSKRSTADKVAAKTEIMPK